MMKVLGVVAATVIVILGLALSKPDSFRVERRIVINAAPQKVFTFLDDPRRQSLWSPWDKKDPAMKKTYSGNAKGVGAVYEWDGNKHIGAGRLTIVEMVAPSKVVMDLEFIRPMKGRNIASYTVTPRSGGASEVAWAITGPMPLLSKVMCLFMDMDKMIGGEFEKGLADLKALAEKA
ncbi:MAG: SRPBCC family protein [Elusimicrobia bacterium]|nr:SRPBCC family protein [Elusimicrobiota bacterium]